VPLGPFLDATGASFTLAAPPRRIVSLIPSITETLFALGAGSAVAGCTVYCSEPADGVATKTRVGGEKNPKLDVIRELGADLVIANVEENVREHVLTLRGWGIPVYVTYPHTVTDGIRLVRDLGAVVGLPDEGREMEATLLAAFDDVRRRLAGRAARRVFYPIWRMPWMTINRDTYAHDMLAVCGGENVFAASDSRYPEVTLDEISRAAPDVILLPDEPYRFRQVHIGDFDTYREIPAVRERRIHLIDGKLATWYGPRIAHALRVLPGLIAGE
jgi:ABC-type Fe3+-hydroxamate transport system substrate-binding protein